MTQRRRRQHAPELLAEIERIVSLKCQLPRYADVARAHNVTEQIVKRLIFERMPTIRTKVRFHVEPRREPMTREELDRMAARLMRGQA